MPLSRTSRNFAVVDAWTKPLLGEALERLAGDAEEQEQYLRAIGTWPSLDELALELDDVSGASEGWVSPELRACVRLLDEKLDGMSGDEQAAMWEPEALTGPEWAEVRRLAADAVVAFRRHS
jgi:hypothetical protein